MLDSGIQQFMSDPSKRPLSLNKIIDDANTKEHAADHYEPHFVDPVAANELEQMENRVAVGQLLEILPESEYQVTRLLYGEGMTVRDAGETLGVSHTQVRRLNQSALTRMRKFLELS